MKRSLIVAADGGSRGNPGVAGYGAVVYDAASGDVLAEVKEGIGTATNNVAEYNGLIAGLRAAAAIAPGAAVEVTMDSKLVVEQMSGRWQIKHPDLRTLSQTAASVAGSLGEVRYTWVPRASNAHADRLANEAMDAATASRPTPATPAPSPATPRTGWRRADPSTVTTILLRHGQTPLSIERRFAGATDIPLTDTGLAQAQAAATRLAASGTIDAIVTSPLRRAQQTAAAVATATGVSVTVEDRLRECHFGKWEGLSFAEASEAWPEETAAWRAGEATPPGGESFTTVADRTSAALDDLLADQQGRTILLVSHVTPIKALVARALQAPVPAALFRMHLDVAAICEADWHADGSGLLRSYNDTAHLTGL